jgi:hypothetical protein
MIGRVLGKRPSAEDVLLSMRALCTRGTDALVIAGADDDGLDYIEFHLGPRAHGMRAYENFRLMLLDGTDHTFSHPASLDMATGAILQMLESRYAPPSPRLK